MPQIKKSIKFKEERQMMVNFVFDILELDDENCFTLYEVDYNKRKQRRFKKLIVEIVKYYSKEEVSGLKYPNERRRAWLTVVKQLLKPTHNFVSKDIRINDRGLIVHSKKYKIVKKEPITPKSYQHPC